MPTVTVNLQQRDYRIEIKHGLINRIGSRLPTRLQGRRAAIVTNDCVGPLYAKAVSAALADRFKTVTVITIPDGERYKTIDQIKSIYRQCAACGLERTSPLFALGGGVIGDITGFVAATFLRGVPCIQIPTTLLAQVDSSVGGKTGVNLPEGKNLVGAFYQPLCVFIDPDVLKTLPDREMKAGMAEVIKYALIKDSLLYELLTSSLTRMMPLPRQTLERVITLCCAIKAGIVSRDEHEHGIRAILNYGHTIGHAIETLTSYTVFKHGEAVAIGMVAEARIAAAIGLCSTKTFEQTLDLVRRAGLPTALPNFSVQQYLQVIQQDKKRAGDKIRMILPRRIGAVVIKEFTARELAHLLQDLLPGNKYRRRKKNETTRAPRSKS
ncbi:MAG: 3-dehydroquinate synthase [Desulfobacterota bacterium]|nr:3-dehydroquinate synthase [Thermodesulfobacteriota bacterium]